MMPGDLSGQMIGRYKIVSLLGEGGMGSVYKAYDNTLQRSVAIKLMHSHYANKPDLQGRFLQEARSAARLDHPGIVKVHDSGTHDGKFYIVMEYLPGENLAQILRTLRSKGQWIILKEAVGLASAVAQALEYAHRNGVLHRDIKPDNIMLKPEPFGDLPYRPVITDLGLAKLAEGGMLTQEGTSMGTPAYMSPEQAQGYETDPRSDVYSLGILVYELCTGQPPFRPRNLAEAIRLHTQEQPEPPRSLRPELPVALEAVILKAIQKESSARYASAGAFGQALVDSITAASATVVSSPEDTVVPGVPEAPKAKDTAGTALGEVVSLVTVHMQQAPEERGPSLVEDFNQAFGTKQAVKDSIQIIGKEGFTKTLLVEKATLIAGRDEACDLPLNSSMISRQHVRIMRREGVYRVVDLNSTNGSYLDNVRLLPGVPEEWTEDKLLRIGDFSLRLVRAIAEPQPVMQGRPEETLKAPRIKVPAGRPADPSTEVMLPGQAEPVQPPGVSSGSQVSVTLETSTLFVEPGGSVTTSLRLLNMGSLVDHYSLKVEGLRPAWVNLSRNSVQLLPGREETVSLTIKPPLDSASLAGAHPYRVSVASTASSGRISRAEAVLNIAPFTRFDSEMHPEVFATGKNSRLMINNQGNRSETFRVIWRDPGDELVFHPSQADVQSPAGQSAVTEFWIEPRQAHWFGADRTYAFTADVYAPDGSARSHSGEFTSRPRYSTSLLLGLAALLGILACLAVVAALVIPGLLPVTGETPTATPPQVVVVPGQETTLPLIFTPTTQFTLTSFPTNTPPLSPTITATLPPVANFQGTWQTNFANIDFASQDGRQVSGQYRWYGGANAIDIRGTVEDNTLKGTVASGSVSFQFTLRPDGLSFEGTWTGPQGVFQWCGVRSGALFDGCGFSGHWNTISDYDPDAPPTADLVQTGDRLTGTFFNGTDVGTIDGRLGAGGNGTHYIAIGQYTVGGGSGDFRWTLKDFGSVQFQGLWANSGGTHPWCGWRDFSSQPDPCFLGE